MLTYINTYMPVTPINKLNQINIVHSCSFLSSFSLFCYSPNLSHVHSFIPTRQLLDDLKNLIQLPAQRQELPDMQ